MGYHKATGNSVVEDPKISQIYDLLINGIPKKEVQTNAPFLLI